VAVGPGAGPPPKGPGLSYLDRDSAK